MLFGKQPPFLFSYQDPFLDVWSRSTHVVSLEQSSHSWRRVFTSLYQRDVTDRNTDYTDNTQRARMRANERAREREMERAAPQQ